MRFRKGGLQAADKVAGLGQVGRGRLLDGPEPVAGRGGVPVVEGLFRRAAHQHNAGEALGQRVVDFAGQPGAFGQRAGVVLAAGKFGAGAAQLLGGEPLVFGFQVERPVGQPGDHGKGGPEGRSQHHRQLQGRPPSAPALWNHSATMTSTVLSAIAGSASRSGSTCSCRKKSGKASQTKSALAQISSSQSRQTAPSHKAE